MIKIISLTACPNSLPQLTKIWAELLGEKWDPYFLAEQASQHVQKHGSDNNLPITLVAFKDEQPVGMCTLRENDGVREDLKPWLASLVVDTHYQRQGIARELIEAIKQKAKSLQYKELFLFTFGKKLPKYYAQLGWQKIGMDAFEGKPVTIMRINL